MRRMILISEDELNGLIREGISDAVTNITKKIASSAARLSYNNEMFPPRPQQKPWGRIIRSITPSDHGGYNGGCGSDIGWCGSTSSHDSGGCGSDSGGCGSSSSRGGYNGGCGSPSNSGSC